MFQARQNLEIELPAVPEGAVKPLSTFRRGESGVIIDISGQETAAVQRLMELGFICGAHVTAFSTGDPMLIELNGNKIGMGRSLLRQIAVMVLE